PVAVGAAHAGAAGDEAAAPDGRRTPALVAQPGAGATGDRAALASCSGAAQVDRPQGPTHRAETHRRDARGLDRPAGAGEPAVGLRPDPGRAGQARPRCRVLDDPRHPEAARRAAGTAPQPRGRYLASLPGPPPPPD